MRARLRTGARAAPVRRACRRPARARRGPLALTGATGNRPAEANPAGAVRDDGRQSVLRARARPSIHGTCRCTRPGRGPTPSAHAARASRSAARGATGRDPDGSPGGGGARPTRRSSSSRLRPGSTLRRRSGQQWRRRSSRSARAESNSPIRSSPRRQTPRPNRRSGVTFMRALPGSSAISSSAHDIWLSAAEGPDAEVAAVLDEAARLARGPRSAERRGRVSRGGASADAARPRGRSPSPRSRGGRPLLRRRRGSPRPRACRGGCRCVAARARACPGAPDPGAAADRTTTTSGRPSSSSRRRSTRRTAIQPSSPSRTRVSRETSSACASGSRRPSSTHARQSASPD